MTKSMEKKLVYFLEKALNDLEEMGAFIMEYCSEDNKHDAAVYVSATEVLTIEPAMKAIEEWKGLI